jgi:hypothetical protein
MYPPLLYPATISLGTTHAYRVSEEQGVPSRKHITSWTIDQHAQEKNSVRQIDMLHSTSLPSV